MAFFYENWTSDFYFRSALHGRSSISCPSHIHYYMELVYVRTGHATAIIDSVEYPVEPDSIFVIFPNQIHEFRCTEKQQHQVLIFNPNLVPELAFLICEKLPSAPFISHVSEYPEIVQLLGLLKQEAYRSKVPLRNAALRGLFLSLTANLLRLLSFEESDAKESYAVRSIIDYCIQNYSRELSLEIVGKDLHMSKYYISHLFNNKLGVSFNNYINFWRVSAACRHLSENKLSVTEISAAVGFGTIRTFNRAFQKQLGISPSEYRQQQMKRNITVTVAE